MKVDLHTHSTASDGQYPPAQLVARAREAGVEVLALTDHDTIRGLDEAAQAGQALGLRVLRGIELGAKEDRNLHILGLGLNDHCPALTQLCQTMKDSRDERKHRIIAFLREKGIDLDLAEVEAMAGGDVIARPHFARVMVRHGYVATTEEAFARYLDTDEYQRIERFKADAATCIAAIHDGGGKAVLAHPYQLRWEPARLETLVRTLQEQGLDGLECYYPKHTPAQQAQYLRLAERYGLGITAGSDFHGEAVHPGDRLIPTPLDAAWLWEGTETRRSSQQRLGRTI